MAFRSLLAIALVGVICSHAMAVDDPFAGAIPKSSFTIPVNLFATLPTDESPALGTQRPLAIELAPSYDGSGRVFVNSLRGPLYSISSDGSTVTEYLDLRDAGWGLNLIEGTMQQGLQGFAFHPQFNTPSTPGYGKFYTLHSTSNETPTPDFGPTSGNITHHDVLLEWTATNPLAATYAGSAPREMLRLAQPFVDHNTRTLAFNRSAAPESADYGKLYMSIGDGGGGNNVAGLAGDGTKPFGVILRLDPLGNNSANGDYGIPSDNPFVGADTRLDEIYAYGFRNPQHFSFDPGGTHQIFVSDIGQGVIEEVNVVTAGGDYGWSTYEGSYEFIADGDIGANVRNSGVTNAHSDPYIFPVAEYDHTGFVSDPSWSGGVAVAGGYVYRDHQYSPLYGQYVFSDFPSGRVFIMDAENLPDGGQGGIQELRLTQSGVERIMLDIIKQTVPTATRADLRFGIDEAGKIYMVNKADSRVYVLDPQRLSLGDQDGDGDADADDIDLLAALIRAGDPDADINGDTLVNLADLDLMVSQLVEIAGGGNGTRYGDANLSGGVPELTDYNLWRTGTGGWAGGDFDGSGGVPELNDYNLWRTGPTAIGGGGGEESQGGAPLLPEPATWMLMIFGVPAYWVRSRFIRGKRT